MATPQNKLVIINTPALANDYIGSVTKAIEVPWPTPDMSFALAQPVFDFTLRVLTQEERDSLVYNIDFIKKCEWAIRDYASYRFTIL